MFWKEEFIMTKSRKILLTLLKMNYSQVKSSKVSKAKVFNFIRSNLDGYKSKTLLDACIFKKVGNHKQSLILISILLIFQNYRTHFGCCFWCVNAVFCSIQSEVKRCDKWQVKWARIFTCTLLELYICSKEKKLMQHTWIK